jgi:Sec-independent protein translocase protein TatA
MNFMGMGVPELGVIFLVAFLVLGPARAIDMAKNAGKVLGDLRRSFGDVTSAMTVETMEQPSRSATVQDQKPDPQLAPLPGVPMLPEIPPEYEDIDQPDEAPVLEAGDQDKAETESGTEDKG